MADKSLFLIHGRNFKPPEDNLKQNWLDAIEHGLKRDYGESSPEFNKFKSLKENFKVNFIYYGDLSNAFLGEDEYDKENDVSDRNECLNGLKTLGNGGFTHKNYQEKVGIFERSKNQLIRFVAPGVSWLARKLSFSWVIKKIAPDLVHYWESDTKFGSEVRGQLTGPLLNALKDGDDIMLVGHSLGTMISYDVLWKFSYYWEYKKLRKKLRQQKPHDKVSFLVTLGSPLGNSLVQKNLKGAVNKGERRYPTLIKKWINIAAVGDYICHDNTLEDDYKKMKKYGLVESIKDLKIYNLAIRGGKSNPHHGTGYLIHPKFIKVLANWLNPKQSRPAKL